MSDALTPTTGEALVIWRRRKGLNQFDAAKKLDVPVDRYRDWEADKTEDAPRKPVGGGLKVFEVCYLLRRRAKLTQRELAVKLGCTRLWVILMEVGEAPTERLKTFWGV